MYEAYWNLQQRPFEDALAAEFYFASRTHQTALLKLRYLLDQRKGIGLIAGEHGLGKTLLTHVLEREGGRSEAADFVRLVIPQLSPSGTLAYLAGRLGAPVSSRDGDECVLRGLEEQLQERQQAGRHCVFVIDDAHLLEIEHLHLLRLLLNLREAGRADFSLILSGRTELLARLTRLGALDQRIVVRAALEPLSAEETPVYVQQRLRAAGRETAVFSAAAAQAIWELSQGIPRRINQLCDLALLVGFVDELQTIDAVEIEAAAEELLAVAA
jgi:general secretion pathway protein A